MFDYRTYLKSVGFYLYEECGCGGTKHLKFKNDAYQGVKVDVMPNRNMVDVIWNNRYFKSKLEGIEFQLKIVLDKF